MVVKMENQYQSQGMKRCHIGAGVAAIALVVAACGGTTVETEDAGTPDEPTTDAPVVTESEPTTEAPEPSLAPSTTDAPESPPALDLSGDAVMINWDNLPSTPFFSPAGGGTDPLFLIHTNPATDGFFLSFEMYTTGYGREWTGEIGTFAISCVDAVNSTGICPYFDPDGPGPDPVKGDDFATTGLVTIVQLDADGFEIIVHELIFSDGTIFNEFTMTG